MMKKNQISDIIKKTSFLIALFTITAILGGCNQNQSIVEAVFQDQQTELTPDIIIAILNKILYYLQAGVVTVGVIFFIWGGIQYLTSFGDKEKMEKGKKTVTWAIIGMVIIVVAKLLMDYLISKLWKY